MSDKIEFESLEELAKRIESWPPNSYMTVSVGNMQRLVDHTRTLEEKLAAVRRWIDNEKDNPIG